MYFAMAYQTNIFGMHNAKDMLDGTNYPMRAFMIKYVLDAKQLEDIVIGFDERPTSRSSPNSPSLQEQLTQINLKAPFLNSLIFHNPNGMVRMLKPTLS